MIWRDVSGSFILNTEGFSRDPNKVMVKLHIEFDMEFANDGTVTDFDAQKNYFINRNRYRDTHYEFTQTNRLRGYDEYNLVNIGEEATGSINTCMLVLPTLLCVNEFYKSYVDSFCIHQEYKILKIVSTRTNLNVQENFNPYMDRIPRIIVMNNTITFNDPSKLGEVTVVPDLPALDDLTPTNAGDQGIQGGGQGIQPVPNQGVPVPNQGVPVPYQVPVPNQGVLIPNQGVPIPNQGVPVPNQGVVPVPQQVPLTGGEIPMTTGNSNEANMGIGITLNVNAQVGDNQDNTNLNVNAGYGYAPNDPLVPKD